MAHMIIFFIFSGYFLFIYFIKNPQTTIAPTFLTHIISAIGGVRYCLDFVFKFCLTSRQKLELIYDLEQLTKHVSMAHQYYFITVIVSSRVNIIF